MEIINHKRNVEIDIVKGLAIILMVIGHVETPAHNFIYLFHMAVFFIAAGYFYKDNASESLQSVFTYTVKKLKGLWLPYALWTAIFSLLRNFFIDINVYTNNPLVLETVDSKFAFVTEYWSWKEILINIVKGCILPGNVQVGGALWFLATLLQISVLYCIVDFVLKKLLNKKNLLIAQGMISVLFLLIGYLFNVKHISLFGIGTCFSCYCLFYAGLMLNKYSAKLYAAKVSINIILFVISIGILLVLNRMGSVGLAANNYNNPIFLLLASIAGWFMLYQLAALLKKNECITKMISYIGKNTLPIVILHFLAFKVVSFIGVMIQGEELYKVAAFPVLYLGLGWRILYTLTGIIIPLGVNEIWKYMKGKMIKV